MNLPRNKPLELIRILRGFHLPFALESLCTSSFGFVFFCRRECVSGWKGGRFLLFQGWCGLF